MLPISETWAPRGRPLATVLPLFPIYIPSKGRASLIPGTVRMLSTLRVPFSLVVEAPEVDDYRDQVERYGGYGRVLVLDPEYQRRYEPCCDLPPGASRGSGPARNFAWDHALSEGHSYYWCLDDNHIDLEWFTGVRKIIAADAGPLRYAEELARRYQNVGMAGLSYESFCIPRKMPNTPMVNSRIYSCNLIRTDITHRWRGVYNEDTILSLDLLKAGWNTVMSRYGTVNKTATMRTPGGNTSTIYAAQDAHLRKAQVLVRTHPDVSRVTWRFNRVHHYVDFRQWRDRPFVPFPDATPMPDFRIDVVQRHWITGAGPEAAPAPAPAPAEAGKP